VKTFKLISLQIVEDSSLVDVVLRDGLIINREDEQSSWLIEAFTDLTHLSLFQKAFDSNAEVFVQVVISKKENDPATFITKITSLKKLDGHVSILFDGKLKRSKNNYAELLLDDLLHKGLGGDTLLNEFRDKMKSKPMLIETKK
jgi:hypothetical protein